MFPSDKVRRSATWGLTRVVCLEASSTYPRFLRVNGLDKNLSSIYRQWAIMKLVMDILRQKRGHFHLI